MMEDRHANLYAAGNGISDLMNKIYTSYVKTALVYARAVFSCTKKDRREHGWIWWAESSRELN